MKSVFPPPSQLHPNSVWQPSGRLESKSDSHFAKTPVVAQLSLHLKQMTPSVARVFFLEILQTSAGVKRDLRTNYTHLEADLYIAAWGQTREMGGGAGLSKLRFTALVVYSLHMVDYCPPDCHRDANTHRRPLIDHRPVPFKPSIPF